MRQIQGTERLGIHPLRRTWLNPERLAVERPTLHPTRERSIRITVAKTNYVIGHIHHVAAAQLSSIDPTHRREPLYSAESCLRHLAPRTKIERKNLPHVVDTTHRHPSFDGLRYKLIVPSVRLRARNSVSTIAQIMPRTLPVDVRERSVQRHRVAHVERWIAAEAVVKDVSCE